MEAIGFWIVLGAIAWVSAQFDKNKKNEPTAPVEQKPISSQSHSISGARVSNYTVPTDGLGYALSKPLFTTSGKIDQLSGTNFSNLKGNMNLGVSLAPGLPYEPIRDLRGEITAYNNGAMVDGHLPVYRDSSGNVTALGNYTVSRDLSGKIIGLWTIKGDYLPGPTDVSNLS